MKQRIKRLIERLFHVRIYGARVHGRDDCADVAGVGLPISMIVDVGANVGQSAVKFRAAFPSSTIHCIEPVSSSFDTLVRNLQRDAKTLTHRIALGNRSGVSTIYLKRDSTTNSMIEAEDSVGSENVTVMTLTGFAESQRIGHIDLLKVDAEGFDLEVLRGGEPLLATGRIKFVLVETGFTPGDHRHVLFDEIRSLLVPFGFGLFGIYDQQVEWSGPRFLRFTNVCFCHRSVFSQ